MQKSNRKTIDMTKGSPLFLMLRFALPMMIGSVFQTLYTMVDSAVLGRYVGSDALAAIGATSSTTMLLLMFATGTTTAISIVLSQAVGAGEPKKIRQGIAAGGIVTLAMGIVLGLISLVCARPLMRLLSTPEDIIDMSVLYVQLTCGICIAQFFYNLAASVLRALGDSKTPLVFLIICSILNVALDLFSVLVLNMGVAGVAVATVGSQAISAVLCILYMFKKYPEHMPKKEDYKVDMDLMKRILSMGGQMALQSSFLSVGSMVITRVINGYGADVVAAYTVGSNVMGVAVMLFSNFAFGFSVYVGQNYGAKLPERIKLGVRQIFLLVGGLSLLAAALSIVFAKQLVSIYVTSENLFVTEQSLAFVRIESCFYPFLGWIWLYNNTLKGMGKIAITTVSSIVELCCKIGFSIVLPLFMGYNGIWIAAPLGWILGIVPDAIYYYGFSAKWQKECLEGK